ncbi:MAG: 16S rRNA (cytosine(1402)-N(4))-methyltransferase RsmH [Rikenellaceae bacterium]|jgi:16S rRNA (cytosine1402-N4)-methyltransferase|nr:16S rRNA (cytosine(1402)-N(4))-methyltransferase RsmH [Rikenellaceae bacterium]
MSEYHTPVLLKESVDLLIQRPDGVYADLTFGGGGHSREILSRLGREGHLYGFDQDLDAIENIPDDDRFTFIRGNFRFQRGFLREAGVEQVDGILADLGVSSHHFDAAERGFSFRFDAPLDMRMNREGRLTAAEVVNGYDEQALAQIFREYGELNTAGRLARAVVQARSDGEIATIAELREAIAPLIPAGEESKFLAKLFQAIRIEVNREMDALKMMLEQSLKLLSPGGRLVVITYHSLEDRLVKNFMRSGNFEGEAEKDFFGKANLPFELVVRKAIVPSPAELERNSRSRSAKLRAAMKK